MPVSTENHPVNKVFLHQGQGMAGKDGFFLYQQVRLSTVIYPEEMKPDLSVTGALGRAAAFSITVIYVVPNHVSSPEFQFFIVRVQTPRHVRFSTTIHSSAIKGNFVMRL
jgi:hypothetical protein